ncbi:hypothetical protein AYO21_11062 [Fonsecaea monophora]|uniref:Uncharacterized protein n=1 Tax=Fonsecaea monophora TaxID=254056 RepID=A0A177ETL1_9EURO|nr:hypothetical protein AYO21_11062 [Fonsecaea monophora]KAH0846199.1 hypothetical protein FOPE_12015 [Fonsecaea pedrosoi]OAG34761.1 hypothetical protein AYO21_11062 [Fonsecaea monophora]
MDDKARLEYELAEIELEKRQLQLERRELDIKRRLKLLKGSAESADGDATVKSEAKRDDPSETGATAAQDGSPTELQADVSSSVPVTDGTAVNLSGTPAVEKDREKVGNENCETRKFPRLCLRKGSGARSIGGKMRNRFFTYEPEEQTAAQRKSQERHEKLLAAFTGCPPSKPSSLLAKQKQSTHSDTFVLTLDSDSDVDTSDSTGGYCARAKRRRVSPRDEKQGTDVPGPMTESQQYDLVKHYTGLLLKHMTSIESTLGYACFQKPTVASKLRRVTFGSTHHSIALLHEDFTAAVNKHAKDSRLRCALVVELDKFEWAQESWWPVCEALNTQQERISFITKVFPDVAEDNFSLEECRAEYGEGKKA